eukprot:gnl/TRDRNA2_/TRDRNA2_204420_c0_seq1.p1 gnl/TRDRNA2_/TRDRNA2_204420_c0~~gnl/TRDRNA2_/TRDRNA2_204420_c0_seq1.p1  ORF type:complete len:452 (+),score=89.46 gnl/TRDRNA2_/TRDRNA2_204420_c0_seq1:27-1358(+)
MGGQVGKQFANALTPCVTRNRDSDPFEERAQIMMYLQRVDALLEEHEKLQKECDFHFQRAGLDANGDMRRVELRRLLWTFAHHLGSTELTWEVIEASAVVGTLDPHIPVVTRDQFYRCVLKTVHLVAAELNRKGAELDERARQRELATAKAKGWQQSNSPAAQSAAANGNYNQLRTNPWAAFGMKADSQKSLRKNRSDSSSSSSVSYSEGEEEEEEDIGQPVATRAPAPKRGPAPRPAAAKAAAAGSHPQSSRADVWDGDRPKAVQTGARLGETAVFTPAGGGGPDDTALVNGMMAMLLSHDGNFEPQRLFVGEGSIVLTDPCAAGTESVNNFFCSSGKCAFDLALLEAAVSGEELRSSPATQLLPGYAMRARESLDRMLVLSFAGGEACCIWFSGPEDCDYCRDAVRSEAVRARREAEVADADGSWTKPYFGGSIEGRATYD